MTSIASVVAATAGVVTLGGVIAVAGAASRPQVRRPVIAPSDQIVLARSHCWRYAAALAVVPLAILGGPLVAATACAAVPLLTLAARRAHQAARRQAIAASMPDAIELIVLCIHAGLSPATAIETAPAYVDSALAPGFAAVRLALHRGRALADALAQLTDVIGPPARDLASAIATADRDGLPLAPMLDRLAADARTDRRRQGEADARQLPVRLSFPLVTCTLPSFVLLTIAPAVLGAVSTLRGSAP